MVHPEGLMWLGRSVRSISFESLGYSRTTEHLSLTLFHLGSVCVLTMHSSESRLLPGGDRVIPPAKAHPGYRRSL